MRKEEAQREINNIKILNEATRAMKHRGDMFVGFSQRGQTKDTFFDCPPEALPAAELADFGTCKSLVKAGFLASTVNIPANLDKLRILNSPYGGIGLLEAFQATMDHTSRAPVVGLSIALRALLLIGIEPMNRRGIIHGDIKDDNVVVDVLGQQQALSMVTPDDIVKDLRDVRGSPPSPAVRARLIDWGQMIDARKNTLGERGFPEELADGRVLAWNCPPSIILFMDGLQDAITDTVAAEAPPITKRGRSTPARAAVMRNLAVKIYKAYRKQVGQLGHDGELQRILGQFYAPLPVGVDDPSPACSAQEVIVQYLASALDAYVGPDNRFMRKAYFEEVFIRNIDVYGLIMCYLPVLEKQAMSLAASRAIRDLLVTYCFSPTYAGAPIPVSSVAGAMESIGELLGQPPSLHVRRMPKRFQSSSKDKRTPSLRRLPASLPSGYKGQAAPARPSFRSARLSAVSSSRRARSVPGPLRTSRKTRRRLSAPLLRARTRRVSSPPKPNAAPRSLPRSYKARVTKKATGGPFKMRGKLRMPIEQEQPPSAESQKTVGLVKNRRGVRLTARRAKMRTQAPPRAVASAGIQRP